MAYKRVSKKDEEKLLQLEMKYQEILSKVKESLDLKEKIRLEDSSNPLDQSRSLRVSTISTEYFNFVIFQKNQKNLQLVQEMMEQCEELYQESIQIKSKYGYKDVKKMKPPRFVNNTWLDRITLGINRSYKFRKLQEEQVKKWAEEDYKGFALLWKEILKAKAVDKFSFRYVANDIRYKIDSDEPKSMNNGVFISSPSKEVLLNIRINHIHKLKRIDYKGEDRYQVTISNGQEHLKFYLKNYIPFVFQRLKKEYSITWASN